jgi:hypothetical protein
MENGPCLNILRDMNDRTFSVLRELGVEEGEFGCECGKKECGERLELLVIGVRRSRRTTASRARAQAGHGAGL